MAQAIHPTHDETLTEKRGKVHKTTIQITPYTKDYLDKIKEQSVPRPMIRQFFLIRETTETSSVVIRKITRHRSFYPRGG